MKYTIDNLNEIPFIPLKDQSLCNRTPLGNQLIGINNSIWDSPIGQYTITQEVLVNAINEPISPIGGYFVLWNGILMGQYDDIEKAKKKVKTDFVNRILESHKLFMLDSKIANEKQ